VLLVLALFLGALYGQSVECSSALEAGRRAYGGREYAAAIGHFSRARRECPDERVAMLPMAQAQLMAQRFQDSLATLDSLIAADGGTVEALKVRGDVLYLLGREAEAERSLKAALAIDANHWPSSYALGRVYYQQNRFPEAIALFQRLVERDPKDYRAHDNLALSYAGVGQDEDALRHFLKALELVHKDHPGYDSAYANAANFFLGQNDYTKAFQLAAEAAKRNPGSARNFFLTGKALASLDKNELSVRWFRQAAELDPNYSEAFYWLSRVYRKVGKEAEANAALERFRELSKSPKVRR
jgi:tetratricopeptide (TPR) repeat protein